MTSLSRPITECKDISDLIDSNAAKDILGLPTMKSGYRRVFEVLGLTLWVGPKHSRGHAIFLSRRECQAIGKRGKEQWEIHCQRVREANTALVQSERASYSNRIARIEEKLDRLLALWGQN